MHTISFFVVKIPIVFKGAVRFICLYSSGLLYCHWNNHIQAETRPNINLCNRDIVVFHIINNCPVCSTACSIQYQTKIKANNHCPFARGIHHWSMIFPHTGLVLRKSFPYHDIIIIVTLLQMPDLKPLFHRMQIAQKCEKWLDCLNNLLRLNKMMIGNFKSIPLLCVKTAITGYTIQCQNDIFWYSQRRTFYFLFFFSK